MAECGAIFDYIIHKYGNGRLALPPSHPHYADYLYWFHFSNGSLQPALAPRIGIKPEDSRYKLTLDKLLHAVQHVNDRLTTNTWLAGEEFTAADIMNVWCFTTMRKFSPLDLTDFAAVREWLKRCTERPAYREAMRKGDPELVIQDLVSAKGSAPFAPVVRKFEKEGGTQKL